MWLGTDTSPYGSVKPPSTTTVSIAGLDTAGLKELKESFPKGIDPVDAHMAFEVVFGIMEKNGTLIRGWGERNFERNSHSCYFNNGGKLQKSDPKAKAWIPKFWGGKIPTVANFGSSAPTGFSTKSVV